MVLSGLLRPSINRMVIYPRSSIYLQPRLDGPPLGPVKAFLGLSLAPARAVQRETGRAHQAGQRVCGVRVARERHACNVTRRIILVLCFLLFCFGSGFPCAVSLSLRMLSGVFALSGLALIVRNIGGLICIRR